MVAVSIVIPVYNVASYITDCLQSVMRQTFAGPMECLLVDDCGNDNSMEIAGQMIAGYRGPIVFRVLRHDHNRGLSAARNTGMDAATGDYVCFLDSDDWISDDCIEKLAEPLQKEQVDIVVGDYTTVGGELSNIMELSLEDGRYFTKPIDNTFCNNGIYVMAVNKLYRKEFLLKHHLSFEEGKIHEDEILAFELSCMGKTFYVVREVTYFYRIRENSIVTQQNQLVKIKGYLGVLDSVKSKMSLYDNLDGIYDYYVFWLKRVFQWISKVDLDEELLSFVQKETAGFLDPIPSVRCLENKHNRLVYYACKRNQSYTRFQYVTQEYSNRLSGRVMRNVLNLIPTKKA